MKQMEQFRQLKMEKAALAHALALNHDMRLSRRNFMGSIY